MAPIGRANIKGRKRAGIESEPPKSGFVAKIRNYFLAGVLVTGPIALTALIAWELFSFVDSQAQDLIPAKYNPETYLPFGLPGLGLLLMVVFLTLVGWVAAGYLGRLLLRSGENALAKLPVVRSVYGAIKQILETVLATQSDAFREVVLLEYPRRGIWAIGFITGETRGEVQNVTERSMVNVFLPTTPNPTSGFLLFVPTEDLHVLDMTIEEGIKMVISGGIITPPDRRALEEAQALEDAKALAEAKTMQVSQDRESNGASGGREAAGSSVDDHEPNRT